MRLEQTYHSETQPIPRRVDIQILKNALHLREGSDNQWMRSDYRIAQQLLWEIGHTRRRRKTSTDKQTQQQRRKRKRRQCQHTHARSRRLSCHAKPHCRVLCYGSAQLSSRARCRSVELVLDQQTRNNKQERNVEEPRAETD